MSNAVRSVVVVGGGAAGWITAGRIAARHSVAPAGAGGEAGAPGGVRVTLIESPTINIVGVGEGTWPTMRNTLMKLGVSETDFIRECDATFKQGAKFARWVDGGDNDFYYHPLVLPQGFNKIDLAPYWLETVNGRKPFGELNTSDALKSPQGPKSFNARKASSGLKASNELKALESARSAGEISFSEAVCYQEQLCEKGLAPKLITTPEYASIANYAYHLNAGKFAHFLKRHCTAKLGVNHITDDVVRIRSAPNGDIAALVTRENGELEADLFVDCSGFSSLLLGQHLGVPFVDKSDTLFVDTAIAVQSPYPREDTPIACHTIATAREAGWIWDIGLFNRRGVGYVYSSRHTSDERAELALSDYLAMSDKAGPAIKDLSVRKIPIRSGHRQRFWVNNCVAVGLSAGFLEPLEASALVLVELSADMIAEQFPVCRDVMDITAQRFNRTFSYRWERIIDFLKLHYMLSRRDDTAFWRDNRAPESIPDSLRDQLALWRYRSPGNQDFTSNNEVFPAASYQYVLYGMGFKTDTRFLAHTLVERAFAGEQFARNRHTVEKALASLPGHRDLLKKIHRYGFSAI